MTYKLLTNQMTGEFANAVFRSDGWVIPFDLANTDYQAYLKWLEEGNEVLPPDEVKND